ncbi:hypothetical protein OC842_007479 [Tilletia horrida]|uniref:Uncharacterized protein n=1 Tax=Tilletia horrida TaxID=155126 RepID=A0AAN6JGP3_9BASI|nr:hypothetical protein OC842_007479 [Tilletia horrida]
MARRRSDFPAAPRRTSLQVQRTADGGDTRSAEARQVRHALAQGEDMLGLADTVLNMNTSVHQLSAHLGAVRTIIGRLPRSESTEATVSTTEQLEILQSLSRDHAAIYAHSAKLKLITENPEAVLSNLEAASALRTRRSTAIRLEASASTDPASTMTTTTTNSSSGFPFTGANSSETTDRSEPAIIVLRSSVTAYTLALLHAAQTFLLADGRQSILAGAGRAHEKGQAQSAMATPPSPAHLSLNHTLLSALYTGSAHAAASSLGSHHAKFNIPASPTTEQVISTLAQWAERARLAMHARASLHPNSSLKTLSTRPSVYHSTLTRLSSLDDAGRAEIALLSTFRRLEGLTTRVLHKTASSVSPAPDSTLLSGVQELIQSALASLKEQLMTQLHERVEQLFHAELDLFNRDIRAVLEGGLRGLHAAQLEVHGQSPQPEVDPLGFLFAEPPWLAFEEADGSASAFEQSRNLNADLRSCIRAESRLLEAVLKAVGNAASRLGLRVSAWASGLDKVYRHLEELHSAQTADSKATSKGGRDDVHKLKEKYSTFVQASITGLLSELGDQVTIHPVLDESASSSADGAERQHETASKAVFAFKLVDALFKGKTVLRVLIQDGGVDESDTARKGGVQGQLTPEEVRIQDLLEQSRAECLASWRSLSTERAWSEYQYLKGAEQHVQPEPDDTADSAVAEAGSARLTNQQQPSAALLRAIESLKTSLLQLGLEHARATSPPLLLLDSFVERLSDGPHTRSAGSAAAPAAASGGADENGRADVELLRAVVASASGRGGDEEEPARARLVRSALGPLLLPAS